MYDPHVYMACWAPKSALHPRTSAEADTEGRPAEVYPGQGDQQRLGACLQGRCFPELQTALN